MMQNQTAEIQFVSITYNLNEYTHHWLSCETQSDEGSEKITETKEKDPCTQSQLYTI